MWPDRWSIVSRQILVGLTLEVTVVVGILSGLAGLRVWVSLLVALVAVVFVRCLVALFTFVMSWWYNPKNAAPAPLGLPRAVGMLACETAAFIRLFFYYHPFEPLLNDHDPPTPVSLDHSAVLLVHGFYVNAGFWVKFKRYLKRRGIAAVYTINLDPPFGDIDGYADQLARRVAEVCVHSGRQQVTLVAQSMGGLVCRAYLARYGDDRVEKLITLGTPHRGTVLANFLNGPNVEQMRPGNRWLEQLNRRQAALSFSNHISLHDNVVVPRDNARFPGALEVEYRGLGHVSMAFSGEMMQRVCEELFSQGQKLDKPRQWAQG